MQEASIHVCQYEACRRLDSNPDKLLHLRVNLLVSRLDEQQRRWYVASESMRIGYGGDVRLQSITGMHVETIRRGRTELGNELKDRPVGNRKTGQVRYSTGLNPQPKHRIQQFWVE